MQFTAKELAKIVHGTVEGDENARVWQPCKIEEGCEGGITFLGNAKYTHYIYEKQSTIVIVRKDFVPEHPVGSTLIRVENPYMAVAVLLHAFNERTKPPRGRSWRSSVGKGSKIGKHCYLGPYAVVGRHTQVGNDVKIYPNAYIGDNCKIGDGTIIYAGVKIYEGVEIGRNCIIHAGAVIGADGFGFAPAGDGTWNKIDQIGNVVLEDNVEVGANTCIDRATMGATVVRRGTKLDNLIQVAHNVEVGSDTVMAAQSGIAGSAKVGAHCVVGGQVGIAGHLHVGDGVQIAAQSGILKSVPEGRSMFGSPAFDYKDFMRSYVVFRRLAELKKQVDNLSELHKSS